MRSVKVLSTVDDVCHRAGDRWYVTNGVTPVGPVSFDLLLRGIQAGKVPAGSFIRHEAWKVWRPLAEVAVVTDDVATVASGGAGASLCASASISASTLFDSSDDITSPGCPRDMTPSPSEGAITLEEPLSGNFGARFSPS
jgi:hypothetical protein